MITLLDDSVEPGWINFIERLGLPIFLILFCCAIVWKLLPHVISWFTASTKTATVVAEAIPVIRDLLAQIAEDGKNRLAAVDTRTQVMEQLLRDVLDRAAK